MKNKNKQTKSCGNNLSMEPKIPSLFIVMGSHIFSAQIRPMLNRVILKMLKHLALCVFSLSSLDYLLSTS